MNDDRELVLDAVGEAFNEFIFYYRKLDKELPADRLRRLVREGVVTKDEIVARFRQLVDDWNVNE
jgi:hypothetical protein